MGRMEAAREQRLADAKARRATPEFAAAGEQLVEQRARDAAAAAERERVERDRRAAANMQSAIDAALWSPSHDRHRAAFAAMLADVSLDQGVSESELDDGRSLEVMDAYALTLRPSKRNAAHVLALYVGTFGLSASEAWARLRRIGGGR